MGQDGLEIFLLGTVISLIVLSTGFVLFTTFLFQYKRRSMIQQQRQEIEYVKAIAETEHEIKEVTLNQIGKELHDNIGQVLTVARIRVQELRGKEDKKELKQVESALVKAMKELRNLSRTLNSERVGEFGLRKVLFSEMDRIDSLSKFSTEMDTKGTEFELDREQEIIIFRIVQEFLSNSLKHSGGSRIILYLDFQTNGLRLRIRDNGMGFSLNGKSVAKGHGLFNMKNRAALIGAQYDLWSREGKGTGLDLFVPKTNAHV
ncbi:MAG: hypothetical protein HKN79_11360 [Flavobacteriales bacterium]|nr:hypothetical protein [Flavobacteriales bacterium]